MERQNRRHHGTQIVEQKAEDARCEPCTPKQRWQGVWRQEGSQSPHKEQAPYQQYRPGRKQRLAQIHPHLPMQQVGPVRLVRHVGQVDWVGHTPQKAAQVGRVEPEQEGDLAAPP
jgi:hypothetical protein